MTQQEKERIQKAIEETSEKNKKDLVLKSILLYDELTHWFCHYLEDCKMTDTQYEKTIHRLFIFKLEHEEYEVIVKDHKRFIDFSHLDDCNFIEIFVQVDEVE